MFLDSGAPTQPISEIVILALCICRQDRHWHSAIQSMAARKQSLSGGETADHAGSQTILRSSHSPCMQPGFEPTLQRTMVQQFTVSLSQVLLLA